jgi:autotransporter-associated beta strand protein
LLSISVAPADPNITIALSQTNYTFPSTDTTFNPALTFATTAATPSNTYVVTIIANTNPPTPVNTNVIPVTNTFTVTMATAAPFNPVVIWTPAGANTNWSTAANWSPSGVPGSTNDAKFYDAGAVSPLGTINNAVDASLTVGSLTFGQTNNTHTTFIPSGTTLTLSGPNGLAVGTGSDVGDGQVTAAAITGAGGTVTLSSPTANINVGQAHSTANNAVSTAQATLDLSGLDTFTASAARLLVGGDLTIKGSSGVLNLARTNRISLGGATAPQIDVGDNTQSAGSPTIPSVLRLGQTNAFFADSIGVGLGKTDGTGASMVFNSSFATPVAFFRGAAGAASRISQWSIGDGYGSRTYYTYGTCDFTLGTLDALVGTMYVGKGASVALGSGANNSGTGTFTFGAGSVDINTLEVGYSNDGTGTGTVNASGSLLVVNTLLELGHGPGSSGTLNLSGGTLSANSGITAGGGSAVVTLNNATLKATNALATLGTPGSPLTSLSASNSTLVLAIQGGSPSASVGTLTGGGAANTISISALPIISKLPAQFPVLQYTTASGGLSTFALGTLPAANPAYAGYISNNVANSSIDLVLTGGTVTVPLVWGGQVNGNWDTSTANWKTNGVSTTFQQGYPVVRFDDTLVGNSTVTLTTSLTNGNLTVDNSATDYVFGGSGKLSGGTALTKTGTRTLSLTEAGGDDFTGGITVSSGTLQVGNGGTTGTIPAGKVSVEGAGALVFNRSDNATMASAISGVGALTQNGLGVLALNGSNSAFSGSITVSRGTLLAGTVASLGTASATVNVRSGATLDVNGQKFNNNQAITVSGGGVGGNGAIVNNGTNSAAQTLRNVTLAANTTFGGFSDWDIHSSGNAVQDATLGTSGNGYKLTNVGTNTVTIFGAVVDPMLGDIDIQAGTVSFERLTTGLGDATKTVTVFTNATLQFANASNVWNKLVVLKDGATLRAVQRAEFAGAVTLQSGVGTIVANTATAPFILDAAVGGTGGLTKSGAGILTLTSASTYSGPTVVSQGALALVNSGSVDSSASITLAAGTALDLSALALPTLTITSGRSLGGSGTVVGSVTMASGSTLTVGGPGTNAIGTLTVTNTLLLQAGSTSLMEVSKFGGTATCDQVVASNVTYGGVLTVSGAGGAFAAGDTFKLFSAGSYGGSFSTINLPVGTTWDTTRLAVDGTIKVASVTRPQVIGATPTVGGFQLAFSGPAGNSYRVWASANVAATPVASTWTLLLTNGLFNGTGSATFLDTSATNFPARFYVISVP